MAHSGSNLTAWASAPFDVFDPTNEISSDCLNHVITISGGTGFTAGRYLVQAFFPSFNLGAQGVHNLITLQSADGTTPSPSTSANGATWSVNFGRTDGDGTFGSNILSRPNGKAAGLVFDPDSPIPESMVGKTISLSGTNWTSSNYGIVTYHFDTTPHAVNLINIDDPLAPFVPATAELADGATWALVSGLNFPTVTPNTSFTGAVKVGLAGDSISFFNDQMATECTAAFPNASSVTITDKGVSSSRAEDWVQGSADYNAAVSAFNSAGVTVVNVMLGTNPSVSTASYLASMQSLVSGLFADCPTVKKVVVQEIIYCQRSDFNPNVSLYNAQRASIGNGCSVGTSEAYHFFEVDYCLLNDGVHPAPPYGYRALSRLWLNNGLMTAIVAAGTAISFGNQALALLGVG